MTAEENIRRSLPVSGTSAARLKARLNPIISKDGWTFVWRDDECNQYWESRYDGRYDEIETLHQITEEEFQNQYREHTS
jgi:hypothetical protein